MEPEPDGNSIQSNGEDSIGFWDFWGLIEKGFTFPAGAQGRKFRSVKFTSKIIAEKRVKNWESKNLRAVT